MFTCEVCGKACRSAGGLDQHKKAHGLESDGPLKCFVCDKGYRSMSGLMYHKRNIHGSNVKSCEYELKLKKKAERKTYACPYCPILLQQSRFDAHYAAHHRDKFTFVLCRVCNMEITEETETVHLENHNFRGRGCVYMREEKLADSNPAEAMTAFIKNMKICLDFEYRQTAGIAEYVRGFKMCSLCSKDLRTHTLNDHLRDHNEHDGSHYIPRENLR